MAFGQENQEKMSSLELKVKNSEVIKNESLNGRNPMKILLWTTDSTPRSKFYALDEDLSDCPLKCVFVEDKNLKNKVDSIVFHFGESV